jgi:hypothetical protein
MGFMPGADFFFLPGLVVIAPSTSQNRESESGETERLTGKNLMVMSSSTISSMTGSLLSFESMVMVGASKEEEGGSLTLELEATDSMRLELALALELAPALECASALEFALALVLGSPCTGTCPAKELFSLVSEGGSVANASLFT